MRGRLSDLLNEDLVLKPKGEYIVVIAGVDRKARDAQGDDDADDDESE